MHEENFIKILAVHGILPDTNVSVGDFIVQLLGNIIVIQRMLDGSLITLSSIDLKQPILRFFPHIDQLIVELNSGLYVLNLRHLRLDLVRPKRDPSGIDYIIHNEMLFESVIKYIKVWNITTHNMIKAITFKGR